MVPTNVLTQLRIADSRFCFCSFWEYSTDCAHLLCFVGADDSVRPVRFFTCVCRGRCGHRPLQHAVQNRNRPSIPEMSRTEIDAVCLQLRVVHSSALKTIGMVAILRPNRALKNSRASARNITRPRRLFSPHSFLARQTEPNCKPAERLQFGEDEQRNGRDLPLAAGRGMWSL